MSWLDRTEFVTAVEAATRAPSMLNSQPWRFRFGDDEIDVLVYPRRHLQAADASGWAARIGCGAAIDGKFAEPFCVVGADHSGDGNRRRDGSGRGPAKA